MRMRRFVRSIPGQWFCALCCYALLIAPFGCQFQSMLLEDPDGGQVLSTSTTGLFVNADTRDPLLVAGRAASRDEFFVYGARTADGGVAAVSSVILRQADGTRSSIEFASGRPVRLNGPDGSFATVDYTEINERRIAATVSMFDAAGGLVETLDVVIDLERAAEEVAALVQSITGARLEAVDAPASLTEKADSRAASVQFAFVLLPVIGVVAAGVVILGQALLAIWDAIAQTIHNIALVIFSPLILLTNLLNDTIVNVRFVTLRELFDRFPR